ncbi:MAG: DNA-3-methyladenine glycosylase family protein [Candidatus Limnocylindrales bacterium]
MIFQSLPLGPFNLAAQSRFFGGWASLRDEDDATVMAFPVEGWKESAAVSLRQRPDRLVSGAVHGASDQAAAWRQAIAVLSLDVDGGGYSAVGERDPVIGALQREHDYLRPVLFHSPYEAACSFIIGHRLRMVQARAIRQRLAEMRGDAIEVHGEVLHAFPRPQLLLEIAEFPSLSPEKIERLHGVARAALDGRLARELLRSLAREEAIAQLRELRGIGEFFALGILLRGAGVVDDLPEDEITLAGMKRFYGRPPAPMPEQLSAITDVWRPYRMWCSVLIHASERRARDPHK